MAGKRGEEGRGKGRKEEREREMASEEMISIGDGGGLMWGGRRRKEDGKFFFFFLCFWYFEVCNLKILRYFFEITVVKVIKKLVGNYKDYLENLS